MLPFVRLSDGFYPNGPGGRFNPPSVGLGHGLRWVLVGAVVTLLGAVTLLPYLVG